MGQAHSPKAPGLGRGGVSDQEQLLGGIFGCPRVLGGGAGVARDPEKCRTLLNS